MALSLYLGSSGVNPELGIIKGNASPYLESIWMMIEGDI